MRWPDTLFARVLALHVALALLVSAVFVVLIWRELAQSQARATAPLWAAALRQDNAPLPRSQIVNTAVELLTGPPPPDARSMPFVPRVRALTAELRDLGVPVRNVALSGRTGDAVTWLEIESGGVSRWVGVRGKFEGTDLRERASLVVLLALAVLVIGAGLLSRRIVQPVHELQAAIRSFQAEGQLPLDEATSGLSNAPVELRELAAQFAGFARERREHEHTQRTLLAAISHDLRSPLSRIRLAAELLPDAPGATERRDAIVRNVQVADRLLGSFIDLARER